MPAIGHTPSHSLAEAIELHLSSVHADEAAFTEDGQPIDAALVLATERAEADQFTRLVAAPCRTPSDVQAKLRYILNGDVGERERLVQRLLGEDGAWTTDPSGPLLTFLHSLLTTSLD